MQISSAYARESDLKMKLQYAALLILMLACSARAQDLHCDVNNGKAVTSLDELPAQILDLLGRDRTGTASIADIGGKFNPSDVIIDDSVPMRRLVGGIAGHDCIWLTVEYGGIGHYQKKLEYRLADNIWAQVKGANSARAPSAPPAAVR